MTPDPAELMRHLKRGFAHADRDELAAAIADDFEWHMHWQEGQGDQPTGKVLRGIDEVMSEVHRRRDNWTELKYRDMQEQYLDDLVVQTFIVSGVDEHGHAFETAAVDLYPIRDGKLARKQTYWKQPPR